MQGLPSEFVSTDGREDGDYVVLYNSDGKTSIHSWVNKKKSGMSMFSRQKNVLDLQVLWIPIRIWNPSIYGIFKDQVLSVLVPDLDPWILISMFATRYPKIHVCLKITYFLGKKNVMLITSTVPILGKTRKTLSQPVSQNKYHPPTFLKFLKHCTLHN